MLIETENTSDDEGQGEEDSPSMCKKANDPPLIVFRASNPQVHPRNLSSYTSSSGPERLSDVSKATQLMSRARNTSLLIGNLRLFAMPDYSLEQGFSTCGPQVTCIKKSSGMGEVSKPPHYLLEMLIPGSQSRPTESNILGMAPRHMYFNPAFLPQ